jgi:hypothetical protein
MKPSLAYSPDNFTHIAYTHTFSLSLTHTHTPNVRHQTEFKLTLTVFELLCRYETNRQPKYEKYKIPILCFKTNFIRGFKNRLWLTQNSMAYSKALLAE